MQAAEEETTEAEPQEAQELGLQILVCPFGDAQVSVEEATFGLEEISFNPMLGVGNVNMKGNARCEIPVEEQHTALDNPEKWFNDNLGSRWTCRENCGSERAGGCGVRTVLLQHELRLGAWMHQGSRTRRG